MPRHAGSGAATYQSWLPRVTRLLNASSVSMNVTPLGPVTCGASERLQRRNMHRKANNAPTSRPSERQSYQPPAGDIPRVSGNPNESLAKA